MFWHGKNYLQWEKPFVGNILFEEYFVFFGSLRPTWNKKEEESF